MLKFFNEQWMSLETGHEAAWDGYQEYILDNRNNFSKTCKSYVQNQVNIHDFSVINVQYGNILNGNKLSIYLELEKEKVLLSYKKYYLSPKNAIVLNRVVNDNRYTVAYDELGLDAEDFVHRISFFVEDGLDGELLIRFERFDYEL